MSLAEHHLPSRESAHSTATQDNAQPDRKYSSYRQSTSISKASQPLRTDQDDNSFDEDDDNMLEQYYDAMPSPETQANPAPALPAKSALRASRLLDSFNLKLDHTQPASLSRPTPQAVYLSSEEEASSSADEFSEYEFDSDSDESGLSCESLSGHEDTAKVVSVVYVGKPSIIDLSASRRSASPDSNDERQQAHIGISSSEPSGLRRLSISSTATGMSSRTVPHPPRSSSRQPNVLSKSRPSFLSIDPYASKPSQESTSEEDRTELDSPATPRTPTSMLKRGMSLMRKRSRMALKDDFNASKDQLSMTAVNTEPAADLVARRQSSAGYPGLGKLSKRNARDSVLVSPVPESPVIQSPATPTGSRSRILSSFHMRKSTKA